MPGRNEDRDAEKDQQGYSLRQRSGRGGRAL